MLLWRHGRELGRWRMADDCGFRDPSKLRSRLLASNRRRYLVEWLNSRLNPNDHERIATKPQKIPVSHLATEPSIQKGALEPKKRPRPRPRALPRRRRQEAKKRSALPWWPCMGLGLFFWAFSPSASAIDSPPVRPYRRRHLDLGRTGERVSQNRPTGVPLNIEQPSYQ